MSTPTYRAPLWIDLNTEGAPTRRFNSALDAIDPGLVYMPPSGSFPGGTLNQYVTYVNNQVTNITNQSPAFVGVPLSPTDTGTPGQYASDGSFFYICYAVNQWGRVAIANSGWTVTPSYPDIHLTTTP